MNCFKISNFQVVNAYCALIAKCRNCQLVWHLLIYLLYFSQGRQSVYPVSSHVASTVWKGSGMTGYYKKDCLLEFNYWIVPVNLGAHWGMMVVPLLVSKYY